MFELKNLVKNLVTCLLEIDNQVSLSMTSKIFREPKNKPRRYCSPQQAFTSNFNAKSSNINCT